MPQSNIRLIWLRARIARMIERQARATLPNDVRLEKLVRLHGLATRKLSPPTLSGAN